MELHMAANGESEYLKEFTDIREEIAPQFIKQGGTNPKRQIDAVVYPS